jgi:hypothetical protein
LTGFLLVLAFVVAEPLACSDELGEIAAWDEPPALCPPL